MYFHIFGFKWKPEATEAQKAQTIVDVEAFKGVVSGLIEVHSGTTSHHADRAMSSPV